MTPGQSVMDLYEPCTWVGCNHPVGKAHTHYYESSPSETRQVVVRRETSKPSLSHCLQRLQKDVARLSMCRTREAVDERIAIIEYVIADIKKADVTC